MRQVLSLLPDSLIAELSDERTVVIGSPDEIADVSPEIAVVGAGESRWRARFSDTEATMWWSEVEERLVGLFEMVKAAGTAMARRGHGRIVVVAGTAGVSGLRGASADAAVSSAAVALTKSLARELAPAGVATNAVVVPDEPVVTAAQVAATVSLLADDRMPSLVGQVIACAAGRVSTRI